MSHEQLQNELNYSMSVKLIQKIAGNSPNRPFHMSYSMVSETRW